MVLQVQHAFWYSFFDTVYETTTWNFHIRGSDDNFPLHEAAFRWKPFLPNKWNSTSLILYNVTNKEYSQNT